MKILLQDILIHRWFDIDRVIREEVEEGIDGVSYTIDEYQEQDGASMDSWSTPDNTDLPSDVWSSTTTLCKKYVRNLRIHFTNVGMKVAVVEIVN